MKHICGSQLKQAAHVGYLDLKVTFIKHEKSKERQS